MFREYKNDKVDQGTTSIALDAYTGILQTNPGIGSPASPSVRRFKK